MLAERRARGIEHQPGLSTTKNRRNANGQEEESSFHVWLVQSNIVICTGGVHELGALAKKDRWI